jgi:hypothetical protein
MKTLPKLPHRLTPRDAFRADVGQRIGVEKDAAGRVWCQLFPLGEWHRQDFPGGKLMLTPALFGEFIQNWKAGGSPSLPVDYNHDEDGPASGWIEDLRISEAGELEGAVKWTESAAAAIKADEKRYLSPTWSMSHSNRRTGAKGGPWLYGAALLNDPFYDSMPRVAASAAPTPENNMEFKKKLCAAMGLPEETSDDELCAAYVAACKATASATEETGKLTASLTAAAESTAKLQARVTELETNEKKHAADLAERDFEAAFTASLSEGHQGLPDMKDTLKAIASSINLDAAKKVMASLPKLPMTEKGIAGKETPPAAAQVGEMESYITEQMKAGKSFVEAQRSANIVKRSVVEAAFTSTTTKPPPAS